MKFRKNIIEGNREYRARRWKDIYPSRGMVAKYKNLFELGTTENDILKIHKQHFALLNEAFSETECKSCPSLEKLVIPDKFPDEGIPGGLNRLQAIPGKRLNWMIFLQQNNLGGCLADDMGLGKTIQMLALLQYNHEKGPVVNNKSITEGRDQLTLFADKPGINTSLLVVPASLVYNWQNEIR
ncbi:MAG: SNF2-related protein [Bacteroidales bacterium]